MANNGLDLNIVELNAAVEGGDVQEAHNWVNPAIGDFSPSNLLDLVAGALSLPDGESFGFYQANTFDVFTSGYPVSFALGSGALPEGLVLDERTGVIYGKADVGVSTGLSIVATSAGGVETTSSVTSLTITLTPSPALSAEVFDLPAGNLESTYYYDSSLLFTNRVDTYSITAVPPGLAFDVLTGILYGIPTSLGTTSLSFSATNTTGGVTTASDDLVVDVAKPVLVLGSSAFLSLAETYLVSNAVVSFDLILPADTVGSITDDDAGTADRLESSISNKNVYFYSPLTVDETVITFGANINVYRDSLQHRWAFTTTDFKRLARFGTNYAASNTLVGAAFKNISITKGGLTTTWAIDSGSTSTEAPTLDELGIGNITFNNVVAGDWS